MLDGASLAPPRRACRAERVTVPQQPSFLDLLDVDVIPDLTAITGTGSE